MYRKSEISNRRREIAFRPVGHFFYHQLTKHEIHSHLQTHIHIEQRKRMERGKRTAGVKEGGKKEGAKEEGKT